MASVNSNATQAKAAGIQTIPANSSWIAAFEYDPAAMRLTTHLKDGAIYQHTFVTTMDWENLKTAKSHGKHWTKNIKSMKQSIRIKSSKSPFGDIKKGGR